MMIVFCEVYLNIMLSSNETEIKTHIGPDTLVFSQLEYDLKLALNSSTARILQCWMLSNTHLSDQFQRLSSVIMLHLYRIN